MDWFEQNTLTGSRLGPLEQRLLEEVWSRGSATVRELLDASDLHLAYTTIMTTLDRLFKKGLLQRAEEGRAFRYSASCSSADLPRFLLAERMRQWIESSRPSALPLSYFVDAIGEHDPKLLEELRLLVEQKRMTLKKREGK